MLFLWLPSLINISPIVFLLILTALIGVYYVTYSGAKHRAILSAALFIGAWQNGLWLEFAFLDVTLGYFLFTFLLILGFTSVKKLETPGNLLRLHIPWILLTIWSAISVTKALNTEFAVGGPARFLLVLVIFWAILKCTRTPKDFQFLMACFSAFVLGQAVFGLLQFKIEGLKIGVIDDWSSWMWWRSRGSFFHSNQLGIVLLLYLPVVLRSLINCYLSKGKQYLYLHGAALILGAGALITTRNRGSWIGLAFALTIIVMLDMIGRGGKVKKIAMQFFGVGLVAVIIGAVSYGDIVFDRFMNSDADDQIEGRQGLQVEAIAVIKDNPILGVGYNNDRFYTSTIFVHNVYLLVAAEIGIPGLLFWLWFLFEIMLMSIKAHRSKISYISNYGKGFIGSLAGFCLASIPGPDFWINEHVQLYFWALVAALVSLMRIEHYAKKQLEARKLQEKKKSFFESKYNGNPPAEEQKPGLTY